MHEYFQFSFRNLVEILFFISFRIDFPPEVIRGESLFTNLVIDETTSQPSNNCDDVFVYITDTVEPGKAKAILWIKLLSLARAYLVIMRDKLSTEIFYIYIYFVLHA